jgi:hypothetical protein
MSGTVLLTPRQSATDRANQPLDNPSPDLSRGHFPHM